MSELNYILGHSVDAEEMKTAIETIYLISGKKNQHLMPENGGFSRMSLTHRNMWHGKRKDEKVKGE